MKNKLLACIASSLLSVILISCYTTDDLISDSTLSESISSSYLVEAQGKIDGSIVNDVKIYTLAVRKESASTVTFTVTGDFKENSFILDIPGITLTGNPYDVSFDFKTDDAMIFIDKSVVLPVEVSVMGWMKTNLERTNNYMVRNSPYVHSFISDINIDFMFINQKVHINITSAKY